MIDWFRSFTACAELRLQILQHLNLKIRYSMEVPQEISIEHMAEGSNRVGGSTEPMYTFTYSGLSAQQQVEGPYLEPLRGEIYCIKDIFDFLIARDVVCLLTKPKYLPCCDYFSEVQDDITESMRGILVDWLVDVHKKFGLKDETLFFTVNLLDRFLAKRRTHRRELQLVGVATMLIASKFEDTRPPTVSDFAGITAHVGFADPVVHPPADPRKRTADPAEHGMGVVLHLVLDVPAALRPHRPVFGPGGLGRALLHRGKSRQLQTDEFVPTTSVVMLCLVPS